MSVTKKAKMPLKNTLRQHIDGKLSKPANVTIAMSEYGKVDISLALKLKFVNGLTDSEIANQFGVTKQAINQQLAPFRRLLAGEGLLNAYRQNFDKILENVSMELLFDLLDPAKRKSASLNNVAYAFTQINQALRLHRGESTLTVSYAAIRDDEIAAVRSQRIRQGKREALEDKINAIKRQIIDVTPSKPPQRDDNV